MRDPASITRLVGEFGDDGTGLMPGTLLGLLDVVVVLAAVVGRAALVACRAGVHA